MKPLEDKVAVVAGASRGAGRGIALALGEAGATVYVAGRTVRGGTQPSDGAPGTIEDTAEELTARGGCGIAVRADCTQLADVAALIDRVQNEQGKLDVLANAVWGGADAFSSVEDWRESWKRPFWEQPFEKTEELKKMFRLDLSESVEYIGRAVAALSADSDVLEKTGKIHFVADRAREYGFTDIDGTVIPRFRPFD